MGSKDATSASAGRPLKPLKSNSPKIQYLIVYNAVSALLWTIVLGRVLLLIPLVGFGNVYGGVGEFTKWTQTLAGLEVLHSIFGIVRAPIATTTMQLASRYLLVWLICNELPVVAESFGYSTMLIAWSVTEVIRYTYFTLTLSGYLPKFLTWLRYNTFLVLYPLGISSECFLIIKSIPLSGQYVWFLYAVLGIYVPGSYILFTHMLKQRSKVMRSEQMKRK